MERKFETAIEARKIIDDLAVQAKTLNYNKDLRKLIKNAEKLLSVLSSAEVSERQSHKKKLTDKPREDLANAIDYIEKMLLILRLTQ